MDIQELRNRIDRVDDELVRLYGERMELAREIGRYKRENGIPVLDTERERNLLNRVGEKAGKENENGVRALFGFLMAQSRTGQMLDGKKESRLGGQIRVALAETPELFPPKAVVACQGVEGAYSQKACEKMFSAPSILYCKDFESVFAAIESGLCRYGILPIENSLAGSVNSVYDQMISRNFHIVRSARVKIDHTLIALPGTRTEGIREIWSHEQALQQCSRYLEAHRRQSHPRHVRRCTAWRSWIPISRTTETTIHGSYVFQRNRRSIPARTTPASCWCCPTVPAHCTSCSAVSMPRAST